MRRFNFNWHIHFIFTFYSVGEKLVSRISSESTFDRKGDPSLASSFDIKNPKMCHFSAPKV